MRPAASDWYASERPSGETTGFTSTEGERVSRVSAPVATSTDQTSRFPPREEKNASRFPSGNHAGW